MRRGEMGEEVAVAALEEVAVVDVMMVATTRAPGLAPGLTTTLLSTTLMDVMAGSAVVTIV